MTCPDIPNPGINIRSEEGADTAITATFGADLALVRLRPRVHTVDQVPAPPGVILLRIPSATNATAAETIAGSVIRQTEDRPPVNVIIATLTLLPLVRGPL
jgi:hypothetical protein